MKRQRMLRIITGGCVGIIAAVISYSLLQPASTPQATDQSPVGADAVSAESNSSSVTEHMSGRVVADDDVNDIPWQVDLRRYELVAKRSTPYVANKRGIVAQHITIDDKLYPLRTYRPLFTPNDPQAIQQWTTNARINEAWDIGAGVAGTTLAVIDTGFALAHEEFTDRWHRNDGESGPVGLEGTSRLNCTDRGLSLAYECNLVDDDVDGIVDNEIGVAPYENPSQRNCTDNGMALNKSCNRLDDDGNGYIDDVRGWDVINQDNSVQAGQLSPSGTGTRHGTMVAGAAAATGNNSVGIAGVNWATTILPIQALDDDGYGNTRSVGESIYYAIDQGADVINISLGTDLEDLYVREAIEAAIAAGITVVASSGNDGCDCIVYPARHPEVIAVGATGTDGLPAGFSSWGSTLDIVAPGTGFTLPSWTAANQSAAYSSNVSGTSFSAPVVAGLLAAYKSHVPSSKPLHLVAALHETTNRATLAPTEVRNDTYGYGRFDAFMTRSRAVTPRSDQQVYAFSRVSTGNYFTGQAPFESPGPYVIKDCQFERSNLPMYELKNGTKIFFSLSEIESRRAVALGYAKTTFAGVCLAQPQDSANITRLINVYSEFKNIFLKP